MMICGLDALHKNGILYWDLKFENIMLTQFGHIKLIDFGLSRFLEKEELAYSWCGTLGYVAPEVILQVGHNFSADIWSLGTILCEMLGGFSPFYNDDPQKMYDNTIKGKIKWPTNLNIIAKHLISLILVVDGNMRPAISEIKEHLFFDKVDWKKCAKGDIKTSFIPEFKDFIKNFSL